MKEGAAERALHDATNQLQITIFTREDTPLRDRTEAVEQLRIRLDALETLEGNGKRRWRTRLLELAAFAIFAACSDD